MIERCERYFSTLDGLIAELVTIAGPEATVVLASDHGFGPTREVFHVNSWLEREGYLAWADAQNGAQTGTRRSGSRRSPATCGRSTGSRRSPTRRRRAVRESTS
jgi:predicted AlkP superfamily phosphohydrolase/phosphomutase